MNSNESNGKDYRSTLIEYWMEKSRESMETGRSEYEAGRFTPAVRSTYYACFYALTAVLLKKGKSLKRHTAVRAALHRELIKTGLLDTSSGRFYDKIFDSRHKGDYQPMVEFESEQVKGYIDQAKGFIKEMEELLVKSIDS